MDRAIAALIEELRSAKPDRAAAIRSSLAAGGPAAYHALVGDLSGSEAVRAAAFAFVAAEDAAPLSPTHLREFLRRGQAAWRHHGDPTLAPVLSDAILALAEPLHALVPDLLRDLSDPDPLVHGAAARDLETLTHFLGPVGPDDGSAGAALRAALADDCLDVRVAAAAALANLQEDPEACVPALVALLGDPAGPARAAASGALGSFGPDAEAAVPALVRALGSPANAESHPAAEALVRIGASTAEVLAGFIALTRRPEIESRRAGLAALGSMAVPTREGMEILSAAAKGDPDPDNRAVAERGLRILQQMHGSL